jgi:hypothetical protein
MQTENEATFSGIFTLRAKELLRAAGIDPSSPFNFSFEYPANISILQGDLVSHPAFGNVVLEVSSRMFMWENEGSLTIQYLFDALPDLTDEDKSLLAKTLED